MLAGLGQLSTVAANEQITASGLSGVSGRAISDGISWASSC